MLIERRNQLTARAMASLWLDGSYTVYEAAELVEALSDEDLEESFDIAESLDEDVRRMMDSSWYGGD